MDPKLQDTGERMIPEHHKGKNIYGAHVGRYQAGCNVVKDKIVLDIACGSGYGSKMMAMSAKKVYGVDIDEETVAYAKQNFGAKNIEYLVGDGERIPLEDASVDVVASYETIEHIKDYRKFMKEVRRVLKPDGLLLLSTPNDLEYAEGNHFHLHEFAYAELKELVSKYFRFHEDYFQTLWMYSSIVPKQMLESEWEEDLKTANTIPLKPDDCIYFFMLCSNREIIETINPQGIIGEHFRQKDHQAQELKKKELYKTIDKYRAAFEKYKAISEKQTKELERADEILGKLQITRLRKLSRRFRPSKAKDKTQG